jgi:uncharacterized repeat protein (TIGR03803 family)
MLCAVMVGTANAASRPASTETVLHQFNELSHGSLLNGVVADTAGNLYGTTIYGGAYNHGLVFELSPQAHEQWKETVLYSFTGGSDGDAPEGGLTLDSAGNIYGTTHVGGASNSGVIFRLTRNGNGGWTEIVLHSFAGSPDGAAPIAPVAIDSNGDIFGTTSYGGSNYGIAFELTESSGSWTENILHTFSNGTDGSYPGGLLLGKDRNLYGAASGGGASGNGLVFKLSPASGNSWNESLLYTFTGSSDGSEPVSLLFDADGNLFGTTDGGGTGASCGIPNSGCGTVFELVPQAGAWKETTLYDFANPQPDGIGISPSVNMFDSEGNLYGITYSGGTGTCAEGCGTAFELSPEQNGKWKLTNEYNFVGFSDDAAFPVGGLMFGQDGSIYGSSSTGGPTELNGSIFKLNSSAGGKWKLTTVYGFPFSDGAAPYTSLLPDGLGNYYGTTSYGGAYDLGAVIKLTRTAKGGWNENIIYSFPTGVNADSPSNLIWDSAGNLYGIISAGGHFQYGSVFELSPAAGGSWTEKDLYDFTTLAYPQGGLVFDKAGNLYGTTSEGGENGDGMIFELSPIAGGNWYLNTIYNLQGYPSDGANPMAGLIIDAAGNLYGTTQKGGGSTDCVGGAGKPVGCGTVFELSLSAGQWSAKILHSFAGSSIDGANPEASLIFDGVGDLYGTTANGGNNGKPCLVNKLPSCGIVFELSPAAGGGWNESILHEFTNSNGDGSAPLAGLAFDPSGNLYGTTLGGGAYSQQPYCSSGCGTLFELSPVSGGVWTEKIVHSFGNAYDGEYPAASVVFDSAGNIYGTTAYGGKANVGTIYEIKP